MKAFLVWTVLVTAVAMLVVAPIFHYAVHVFSAVSTGLGGG
jgi:hypothetical protein